MTGPGCDIHDNTAPNRGLIPRLIEALFQEMAARAASTAKDPPVFVVEAEFVEIYNGREGKDTNNT